MAIGDAKGGGGEAHAIMLFSVMSTPDLITDLLQGPD